MKAYIKPVVEEVRLTPEENIANIGSVCEETGACPGGNIYWDFAATVG